MDRLRFTQLISRQFNQEQEAVRSHVLRMGGLVEQQLSVGLRCLRVMADDKTADRSYKALLVELIEYMERLPVIIPSAVDALFVARSLERVGDHCKNICEHVIYPERFINFTRPR